MLLMLTLILRTEINSLQIIMYFDIRMCSNIKNKNYPMRTLIMDIFDHACSMVKNLNHPIQTFVELISIFRPSVILNI